MTPVDPPPLVETDFLLVGGGIAAVTAAQTLRDEGAEGSILLLCAEAQYPYNRPPLTKEIATGSHPEQLLLATPEYYHENKIDVRLGSSAHAINPLSYTVVDQFGAAYRFGKLLIATGARPCQLSVPGADLDGVFTFRCAADAAALRRWVSTNPGPVAIVGTSFIAMELATSLNRMGLKVTLIDQAEAVFPKIHSPTLSRYFLERCEAYGIKILLGESIGRFYGTGRVSGVQTSAGQTLSCQTVVLAIGAIPQTDFVQNSGIQIDAGVLVDEFLQTNAPDVFAAGDVAAYLDRYGKRQRAEHWENARRQGRIAAKNMLGQRVPYSDVPHYFCDFLDMSFTFLGTSEGVNVRILGGVGLMAAFPLAFAIIIPAVYFPVGLMLLALIFRGVAFEFRYRDSDRRGFWDHAFCYGSMLATFTQGIVLGAFIQGFKTDGQTFTGGSFDCFTPFSILTGIALLFGYALLGAGWLIQKTEGELQADMRRRGQWCLLGVLAAIVIVSLWTPLMDRDIAARWFGVPNIFWFAPVPALTALVAFWEWRALRGAKENTPFLAAILLFLLSYVGIAISLWPMIVPHRLTLWQASSSQSTQGFLLVGTLVLLPVILLYTAWSYWVFRGKARGDIGYH